jgi:uncharacterized repeat protein (TIGR01451 family)
MENRKLTQRHVIDKRWYRLGFALLLALVLLLIPFTVEIVVRIPVSTSPSVESMAALPVQSNQSPGQTIELHLPFGVSLVRATGGLTITKSAPAEINPGEILTYTLTITNQTGYTITEGTIVDNLPTEVTCDVNDDPYIEPPNWAFFCNDDMAVWSFEDPFLPPPITNGATIELVYRVKVVQPLTDGHKIVNSSYEITQTNTGHADVGPPVTTTVKAPTWAISKTVSSNTIQPNQILIYTITVTNTGSLATSGTYTITDTIPTSTTLVEAPGASGTTTLTWTFADSLAALGGTKSVTFSVRVNSPLAGGVKIVNNNYSVAGGNVYSPAVGEAITVTVDSPVTLSIGKTVNPDPVRVNDLLTYTLTVTNASATGPAEGVVITETLPGEVTYQSAGFVGGASGTITPTGNTVVWTLNGTIPANNSVQVTVTARVNGMPLPNPPMITNTTYSASADNAPLVAGSALTTTLQAGDPTTVTVTTASTSLNVCQSTIATATVVDNWNNPVPNIPLQMFIDNTFPAPPTGPSYGNATITPTIFVTSDVQGVANAYVQGTQAGNISVGAGVLPSGVPFDQTDIGNDINFADPPIPTAIIVTVAPSSVFTGGTATVTATVSSCVGPVSGQVVTFTIVGAFGSVDPVTATTNASGIATSTVTAGSTVGTTTITGTAGSLQDTTPFSIVAATYALTVTKTANPADGNTVNPEGTINYTIRVTNTGNADATDVLLTDTLPLSVSYVSLISSTNGSGSISGPSRNGNIVALSLSKLEPAKTLVATIEVTVTATVSGTTLSNFANAKSNATGLITSNIVAHTVITTTASTGNKVYLPIVLKQ